MLVHKLLPMQVRLMSERYGIKKVFLATDDTEALSYLKAELPDLQFISLSSFDRSKLQSGDARLCLLLLLRVSELERQEKGFQASFWQFLKQQTRACELDFLETCKLISK